MMLEGFGMLICDGTQVGDIEYIIEVTARPSGFSRASGTIYGRRLELERSMDANKVQLRRRNDGFVMSMGVTSMALGGLSAQVTVIGPTGPVDTRSNLSRGRRMTFGKRL
jgi:hypothetical protein